MALAFVRRRRSVEYIVLCQVPATFEVRPAMYDKRYRPDVTLTGDDVSPTGSSLTGSAHAPSSLSKFIAERSLPSVVQVLEGCYGNISANKDNELYVHSSSQHTVVIAETLPGKMTMAGRSARRPKTAGRQMISLPLGYDGQFTFKISYLIISFNALVTCKRTAYCENSSSRIFYKRFIVKTSFIVKGGNGRQARFKYKKA